jgi:hypothetical protein
MAMGKIHFDTDSQVIRIDDWSVPAFHFREEDIYGLVFHQALVQMQHPILLLVEAPQGDPTIRIELFSDELGIPDRSLDQIDDIGLAMVINDDGKPIGIASVPMCECGVRGCGNISSQFAHNFPDDALPQVIDLVASLPTIDAIPVGDKTAFADWDCAHHYLLDLTEDWPC